MGGAIMWSILRATAITLLFAFVVFGLSDFPAYAQVGALTVGALMSNLTDLAQQLDESAQALLEQGNSAVAQQQMLAAGILRQLVTQLGDTYKGSLDLTFDKISTTQSNVATDITDILTQTKGLESKTATDLQGTVYKLQGGVNHLIGELPFTSKNPAFYGMIVHDIYSDLPKTGIDLELIGLNLTDPDLEFKQPEITVAGQQIPASNISTEADRIKVLLPDDIKAKIGLASDYCVPPSSFPVTIKVFYRTKQSFLLIPYHTDTTVTFNAFALKGKEAFVADTSVTGTNRNASEDTKTFSLKKGQITYGCEQDSSDAASYQLPGNATQIVCNAAWVDTSNTKSQSASCAVGGTTVTAHGAVRGRDRECIVSDVISGGLFKAIVGRNTACNCPGGGHAALFLQGSYHLPRIDETPFSNVSVASQRFLEETELTIPSDDAKQITSIHIKLSRPQCDKQLDDIVMNLPTEKTAIAKQTSSGGLFAATYRSQQLDINKIQKQ
jgi:hypothetical protein